MAEALLVTLRASGAAVVRRWDGSDLLVVRDGELPVPLPRGWRFLLRAQRDDAAVRITDGGGGEHRVALGGALWLEVGESRVELTLARTGGDRPDRAWVGGVVAFTAIVALMLGIAAWQAGDGADAPATTKASIDGDAVEIARARTLAKDQLRRDPDDLSALEVLSFTQYLEGQDAAANATVERMLTLAPEHAVAWNNRGLLAKRRRDYRAEEEHYRRALAAKPGDETFQNNLALCLAHQGRLAEARAAIGTLAASGDPYVELHRAKIAAISGEDGAALRSLERAVGGLAGMDALHQIEFRQDVRIEPAFDRLRGQPRFQALDPSAPATSPR